jgi:hypothetical protein
LRLPSLFFVDGGAAMSVASTIVPSRIIKPFGQVSVDRIENLTRHFVCFEQVTGLEQPRRARRRLTHQVDANGSANGVAVVDRIFEAFFQQTKALLGEYMRSMRARPISRRPAPTTFE